MNWYKKSQLDIGTKATFVKKVFNELAKTGGKLTPSYRIMETSWETLGDSSFSDSWIQVYFREQEDIGYFHVERYYENEIVNDEKARTIKVSTTFSDVNKTVGDIVNTIRNINKD